MVRHEPNPEQGQEREADRPENRGRHERSVDESALGQFRQSEPLDRRAILSPVREPCDDLKRLHLDPPFERFWFVEVLDKT